MFIPAAVGVGLSYYRSLWSRVVVAVHSAHMDTDPWIYNDFPITRVSPNLTGILVVTVRQHLLAYIVKDQHSCTYHRHSNVQLLEAGDQHEHQNPSMVIAFVVYRVSAMWNIVEDILASLVKRLALSRAHYLASRLLLCFSFNISSQ